jgi:hypothetical protein
MSYINADTIGTSTATDNSFTDSGSVAVTTGFNLGIFSLNETITDSWTDTQDSTATYSLTNATTASAVVPGPLHSNLGVDHESDIIWIWLNPVADYTITGPSSMVWNGFAADPRDPNAQNNTMDIVPLSVSQLDGTSPITQAEWDVLDRNWDPVSSGGAGPITTADFPTILGRDPFATNLSGVGRATAPTNVPTGNQYPIFDPNIPTFDSNANTVTCGNRYDFSPGFDMTIPYTQLGTANQAPTQTYSLSSTIAQMTSTTTTDTYKVAISSNFSYAGVESANVGATGDLSKVAISDIMTASLKLSGYLQWTNKWTSTKNNSTLQTQTLSVKNPLVTDAYAGPEQIQIWKDNLYGTFMFYPKPSDTNWILASSQTTITSGSSVTLTVTFTADVQIPAVPTGTVAFYDGCIFLGAATVNGAAGTASLTAPFSVTGQHTIRAVYSGDFNYFHNNANAIVISVQ